MGQAWHRMRREQVDLIHAIHILEGKFEMLCWSQHGISFRVTSVSWKHEMECNNVLPSPLRLISFPIDVDEEHKDATRIAREDGLSPSKVLPTKEEPD
jgi:hypothetical protein